MILDKPSNRLLVVLVSLLVAVKANALYSIMDTGDLLPEGQFRANVETQFITDGDDGVNFNGRFDTWFRDDANLRGVVGFGTTDIYLAAFYKWVPFPDVEGQPAIGVAGGLAYARFDVEDETIGELSIRVHPLISKKFATEYGDFTPYGSLPFGVASREGDMELPLQIVGGVEWKTLEWQKLTFSAEVGFDVSKAFSYISLGAQLYFDGENGLTLE
ncbi:MAG: hypothetical protein IT288_16260 [Bdellovibrionales bacterium]|nr:hypothetical protein [Bdellovibrionales bacterium]